MKVLIVYETLHGTTEKCAKILKEKLKHSTDILSLKLNENIDLDEYDLIIIGGSIHMGVIHTRIRQFIDSNLGILVRKPHGLYLCCMEQGENARLQFDHAYPEELRQSAIVNGLFGGEFNFKKMNVFEKKFTRTVSRHHNSVSMLNLDEINQFADKIAGALDHDSSLKNKF
jgi:menaquinone-dependent protoporphyrinogen oxidase